MRSLVFGLTKESAALAEDQLRSADDILADLIKKFGPCDLPNRPYNPFHSLATAIISQQLSAKAADSIVRRIYQIIREPFHPKDFLAVEPEALRHAGLSARKIVCIRELGRQIIDGKLSFDSIRERNDEAIIDILVAISGIGRWTAQMFLIFGFKRPDILALTDAGLQRAFKLLYSNSRCRNISLETYGEKWKPYRSVASWYLWRHIDSNL